MRILFKGIGSGGFWEACVRSVKAHLIQVLGMNAIMNYGNKVFPLRMSRQCVQN